MRVNEKKWIFGWEIKIKYVKEAGFCQGYWFTGNNNIL